MPNKSALRRFWRKASPEEREAVAVAAGTTAKYLYQQLTPKLRRRFAVTTAVELERATRALNLSNGGVTPIVTVGDIAAMCKDIEP